MSRLEEVDDLRASRAKRVVFLLGVFLVLLFVWAWNFEIAELTVARGTVIPSARVQQIDTLQGGVLTELYVEVGEVVEEGELLARLDSTQSQSHLGQIAAKYRAALAKRARLRAAVRGRQNINFPPELNAYPELRQTAVALFESRRSSLEQKLAGLRQKLHYVREQLQITSKLARTGAASRVKLLQLKQKVADLELKITNAKSAYKVSSRKKLVKVNEKINSLSARLNALRQSVQRTTLRAPVRGIIKDIKVNTIGGAVPPGGTVMTLVPLGQHLLIKARVSPRDIAYIHPGQEATIKITAYDYSVYGGLQGEVVTISPDTVRSEVNPKKVYYPVYIRTKTNALVSDWGEKFPIVPGMVATVTIQTDTRTVWSYLVEPFSNIDKAMHAR